MQLLEQQLTETTTLWHYKLLRQTARRYSNQQVHLVSLHNPEVRIRASRFGQKRSHAWVGPIKSSLGNTSQKRGLNNKGSKLCRRRMDCSISFTRYSIRSLGQGIRHNSGFAFLVNNVRPPFSK